MESKRILIVDDSREHRRYISDVLESEGYETYQAENANEAMQKLEHYWPIDLITLDLMGFEYMGTSLWEKIKQIDKYKDIPVIFISAYSEDAALEKIKSMGIIVIPKPVRDFQDIIDAVMETLNKK